MICIDLLTRKKKKRKDSGNEDVPFACDNDNGHINQLPVFRSVCPSVCGVCDDTRRFNSHYW